jgi:hypothetical protein
MVSLNQALRVLNDPWRTMTIRKEFVVGNHEHRLYKFQNINPEVYGMMQMEFESILKSRGWNFHAYGKYLTINSVDFVHIPQNMMGKPVGGKFAANTIGRESIHDVFVGHTHRFSVTSVPKLGQNRRVKVVETGCCLPHGHIEDYAEHNQTGWSWDVIDAVIHEGRIEVANQTPMFELERKYG